MSSCAAVVVMLPFARLCFCCAPIAVVYFSPFCQQHTPYACTHHGIWAEPVLLLCFLLLGCWLLVVLCCLFALVLLLLCSLSGPQVISLARCGHRVLGGARMVDVSTVAFPAALVSLSCLSLPLLPVLLLRCLVAHLLSVIPQSFHCMSPTSLGTLGRKTLATSELCHRQKPQNFRSHIRSPPRRRQRHWVAQEWPINAPSEICEVSIPPPLLA